MIRQISFIFFLFFPFLLVYCQTNEDTLACNSNILLQVYDHIGEIDSSLAIDFLNTFSNQCKNNAEFSEWSNELLFAFIQSQPTLFLNNLSFINEDKLNYILQEIQSPVNDGIEVGLIKKEIQKTESNSSIKPSVLDALDIALSKH